MAGYSLSLAHADFRSIRQAAEGSTELETSRIGRALLGAVAVVMLVCNTAVAQSSTPGAAPCASPSGDTPVTCVAVGTAHVDVRGASPLGLDLTVDRRRLDRRGTGRGTGGGLSGVCRAISLDHGVDIAGTTIPASRPPRSRRGQRLRGLTVGRLRRRDNQLDLHRSRRDLRLHSSPIEHRHGNDRRVRRVQHRCPSSHGGRVARDGSVARSRLAISGTLTGRLSTQAGHRGSVRALPPPPSRRIRRRPAR